MVRLNKIYTRTGDGGRTRLAGGQDISKNSLRIEAYGTVDELNSVLGICFEKIRKEPQLKNLEAAICRIQHELFNLGSQLAVLPEDRRSNTPLITQKNIDRLEQEIDAMNQSLESLKSFILPGGGEISAFFHLARTVCRRCERKIVALSLEEKLDGTEQPYVNRLSDWLFVAGRHISKILKEEENLWDPDILF